MHPKSIDQFKTFQIGSCEFDLKVGAIWELNQNFQWFQFWSFRFICIRWIILWLQLTDMCWWRSKFIFYSKFILKSNLIIMWCRASCVVYWFSLWNWDPNNSCFFFLWKNDLLSQGWTLNHQKKNLRFSNLPKKCFELMAFCSSSYLNLVYFY